MSELSKLTKLFKQNKISRRQFIAQVSALGLAAAVSPALLAGTARASVPKKGGRFILGTSGGSTTDSMDPGTRQLADQKLSGGNRSRIQCHP
jgi:peptide/nickel transport system substrate-binding protein